MPDDLNQALAEAWTAAGLPGELVWDPAKECPQGHPNTDGGDGTWSGTGELCEICATEWWNQQTEDDDVLAQLLEDPAFHPEWRIGRVPKRLSEDATTLMAAVEAWRQQEPDDRDWHWHSAWKDQPAIGQVMTREDEFETVEAPHHVEALARALLAALKGGSDD